jgi:non-heme chloroperoxidase
MKRPARYLTVLASTLLAGNAYAMDLTFSTIEGGAGVPLSVVQTGNGNGSDILFIHGFSQSYLSWQMQLDSELAKDFHLTAFDLRGHGASGKPTDPESYKSSQLWADDVAAVIAAKELDNPVVVAWSWAGFIVMDYVRHNGIGDIAAINFVGANTALQGPVPPPSPKPGQTTAWLGQMMSADISENLEGVTAFIDMVTTEPLPAEVRHANIVFNMMTPHYVRQAMLGYPPDNGDLAAKLTLPIVVSHGTDDGVVSYDGGAGIMAVLPDGTLSKYDGIGHSPFMEDAERFNRELRALMKRVK